MTSGILEQFLKGGRGKNARLKLKPSRFGRATTPVQRGVQALADGGWLFSGIQLLFEDSDEFESIEVDPCELTFDVPMNNPYLDTEVIELGFPKYPLMQLDHWVHLLWANQCIGGMEAALTSKWRWGLRLFWAALRARSLNKWLILKRISTIGKNCDIHPTAIVEASQIGNGVTIGPYARVFMSRIDHGAVIMAGAQVEFTTMGERSMVSEHSVVRFCLMYPESVASQYLLQQSVLGRKAVTTGGAFTMDLNFEQPIRVLLDGSLISTGQHFLGSAFGHGARIGTGFWLASGRSIPNDYFIVRDPSETLSQIPIDLPKDQPLAVVGNRLVAQPASPSPALCEKSPIDDPNDPK